MVPTEDETVEPTPATTTDEVTTSEEAVLYECFPHDWAWLPKSYRINLGWLYLVLFSLSFLSIPLCLLLALPISWRLAPFLCSGFSALAFMSMVWPIIEWPAFRTFGQLWYEIFDFRCNLSPEKRTEMLKTVETSQYIIGMHPHGIVPFQAILWAAYGHQYLTDPNTGKGLYGFGAGANVVAYMPFLRNIMGWLTCGPADYKALHAGLTLGINEAANAAKRLPRNLFVLPGGIAEVFTSTPGKHVVVFKGRMGLCRLSLETGALLCPAYVFGGTDFFYNLATSDSIISQVSRKMRMGMTIFWGQFGLPIPFSPKVSLCIADPIPVEKWAGPGPVPQEQIEELHKKYVAAVQGLFDKYKTAAGYPDAVLEIQ